MRLFFLIRIIDKSNFRRPRSAIVVQNELLQSELNSASESFNKALMTFLAAQTTKYENELQFLKSEVERLRTTINDTEKAAGSMLLL